MYIYICDWVYVYVHAFSTYVYMGVYVNTSIFNMWFFIVHIVFGIVYSAMGVYEGTQVEDWS